jgi:hypothetical protein
MNFLNKPSRILYYINQWCHIWGSIGVEQKNFGSGEKFTQANYFDFQYYKQKKIQEILFLCVLVPSRAAI